MSPKHSTEHLTNEVEQLRRVLLQERRTVERLRRTLLWVVENIDLRPELRQGVPSHLPCGACGHDIIEHSGEDHGAGASCLFPLVHGAPYVLCACLSFQALTDD